MAPGGVGPGSPWADEDGADEGVVLAPSWASREQPTAPDEPMTPAARKTVAHRWGCRGSARTVSIYATLAA
jgi:hypothetical protein